MTAERQGRGVGPPEHGDAPGWETEGALTEQSDTGCHAYQPILDVLADSRVPDEPRDPWQAGFDFGRQFGRAEGKQVAEREIAAEWTALAASIRATAAAPTHSELVARRRSVTSSPCDRRCGACSLCVRAAAVRRQRGDYQGNRRIAEAS